MEGGYTGPRSASGGGGGVVAGVRSILPSWMGGATPAPSVPAIATTDELIEDEFTKFEELNSQLDRESGYKQRVAQKRVEQNYGLTPAERSRGGGAKSGGSGGLFGMVEAVLPSLASRDFVEVEIEGASNLPLPNNDEDKRTEKSNRAWREFTKDIVNYSSNRSPYCILKVFSNRQQRGSYKTGSESYTVRPSWRSKFKITYDLSTEQPESIDFLLEVWDKHMMWYDDLIGMASCNLADLIRRQVNTRVSLPLRRESGAVYPGAFVHIILRSSQCQ